jgi:hypothetical protein
MTDPERIGAYRVVTRLSAPGPERYLVSKPGAPERRFVLTLHDLDRPTATRLSAELRRARQLEHPALVIAEHVAHEGRHGLVVETVAGLSLGALMRYLRGVAEKLADGAIFEIGREILEAVSCAHGGREAGDAAWPIVHGALGPESIYLAWSGRVRVLGFGLSVLHRKSSEGGAESTFLAPEIRAGRTASVRADVYSVAALLWSLLTEQQPPAHPPPLRELRPNLDASITETIDRALARSAVARSVTTRDLAQAIAPFCDEAELTWNMELLRAVLPMDQEVVAAEQVVEVITESVPPPSSDQPTMVREVPPDLDVPTHADSDLPLHDEPSALADASELNNDSLGPVESLAPPDDSREKRETAPSPAEADIPEAAESIDPEPISVDVEPFSPPAPGPRSAASSKAASADPDTTPRRTPPPPRMVADPPAFATTAARARVPSAPQRAAGLRPGGAGAGGAHASPIRAPVDRPKRVRRQTTIGLGSNKLLTAPIAETTPASVDAVASDDGPGTVFEELEARIDAILDIGPAEAAPAAQITTPLAATADPHVAVPSNRRSTLRSARATDLMARADTERAQRNAEAEPVLERLATEPDKPAAAAGPRTSPPIARPRGLRTTLRSARSDGPASEASVGSGTAPMPAVTLEPTAPMPAVVSSTTAPMTAFDAPPALRAERPQAEGEDMLLDEVRATDAAPTTTVVTGDAGAAPIPSPPPPGLPAPPADTDIVYMPSKRQGILGLASRATPLEVRGIRIDPRKWLVGGVATIAVITFAVGLIAGSDCGGPSAENPPQAASSASTAPPPELPPSSASAAPAPNPEPVSSADSAALPPDKAHLIVEPPAQGIDVMVEDVKVGGLGEALVVPCGLVRIVLTAGSWSSRPRTLRLACQHTNRLPIELGLGMGPPPAPFKPLPKGPVGKLPPPKTVPKAPPRPPPPKTRPPPRRR